MGTWGPAIMSNDLASDIRDEWKELLGDNVSPIDATKNIIESAKVDGIIGDNEEEYEFWICFALIQWKTGRLQEIVKMNALKYLSEKNIIHFESLKEWENSDYKKRIKNLEKLILTLKSAQPKPKKIRKPYRQTTQLEKGDLLIIQLKSGYFVCIEIIHIKEEFKEHVPIGVLYNYKSKQKPNVNDLKNLNVIEFELVFGFKTTNIEFGACKIKQNEPFHRFEILKKNFKSKNTLIMQKTLCFWDEIDSKLEYWIERKGK